ATFNVHFLSKGKEFTRTPQFMRAVWIGTFARTFRRHYKILMSETRWLRFNRRWPAPHLEGLAVL
ncbi:MAG: hypothetical protein DME18_08865, partial [Verrucomicrobia bacterium]